MAQIIVSIAALLTCVLATRASIIMLMQAVKWTHENGPGNLRWAIDIVGLTACAFAMLLVTTLVTSEVLKALGLSL